jgi:very-short-patch-repair endonuclease
MLWKFLRNKQLDGFRFRQQHGFGPYVLDFYCPALRLCIELDGDVHDSLEAQQKDKDRTVFLNEHRISVLRFRNDEVESDVNGVLERIRVYINNYIIGGDKPVQTPTPLT